MPSDVFLFPNAVPSRGTPLAGAQESIFVFPNAVPSRGTPLEGAQESIFVFPNAVPPRKYSSCGGTRESPHFAGVLFKETSRTYSLHPPILPWVRWAHRSTQTP